MAIATNRTRRARLHALRQAAVAFLVAGRAVPVVVRRAPEPAQIVARRALPVVFDPAPVVPVEAGLCGDGVDEGVVSLWARLVSG